METINYTLPEFWASYLINGDASGMEDSKQEEIDAFLKNENLGHCLTCSEEPFFTWHHDGGKLGATCLEYTFPKK